MIDDVIQVGGRPLVLGARHSSWLMGMRTGIGIARPRTLVRTQRDLSSAVIRHDGRERATPSREGVGVRGGNQGRFSLIGKRICNAESAHVIDVKSGIGVDDQTGVACTRGVRPRRHAWRHGRQA